jgi:hypothetical protein
MAAMYRASWAGIALAVLAGCHDPASKPKEQTPVERVAAIEPGLAAVRHLAFERPVPVAHQSVADFRSYVRKNVAKADPHLEDTSAAMVALGLLPTSTDVGKAVEDAWATQAAAYYDPDAKQFFLVMTPQDTNMLDVFISHELTHALQDQHFDLKRYMQGSDGNQDAAIARKFVVEGDAMLAAIAYVVSEKTKISQLNPTQVRAVRDKFETVASAGPHAMAAMLRQQASSANMDPEIKKSLDAMDSIPPAILAPLVDSYMQGTVLALDAYGNGGWAAIDALFRDPPESTEQVLHPQTRLLDKRDRPHRVTLPAFDGYQPIASNVIGELLWSVYFGMWKHDGDGHEEVNWGGDRYTVLRRTDGKLVAVIATTWDTEYDAEVFYNAYVSTLKTRHGGTLEPGDDQTLVTYGADSSWVLCDGKQVYIVDGGDDDQLIDKLIDGATFE